MLLSPVISTVSDEEVFTRRIAVFGCTLVVVSCLNSRESTSAE